MKVTVCGNNFAITSAGIGNALQRSSAALYEAGNTLEQSIGLITAANASIQDPEKVGREIAHYKFLLINWGTLNRKGRKTTHNKQGRNICAVATTE